MENKIDIEKIVNSIKFDDNGLVVAIACDAVTNEVLMQAYMNRESLIKTLETGNVYYYSRSRKVLWLKGETSGCLQHLVSFSSDCDNDSILLKIIQDGVACHTGERSCFFNNSIEFKRVGNVSVLRENIDTIKARKVAPVEGSYTNYLLNKGIEKICKKIGEEATETVIAAMKADNPEMACEMADLLYHMLVLCESAELDFNEVLKVLEDRHANERKRNY